MSEESGDSPYASDETVADYVASVDAGILECRERGRHLFPTISGSGMEFFGTSKVGLLLRRLPCSRCGMVDRIEEWDIRHRNNKVEYASRTRAWNDYDKEYAAPAGAGRITSKAVCESLATSKLVGQAYTELRKAAGK